MRLLLMRQYLIVGSLTTIKLNKSNGDDEPDKSQKGSFSCQFRNNSW